MRSSNPYLRNTFQTKRVIGTLWGAVFGGVAAVLLRYLWALIFYTSTETGGGTRADMGYAFAIGAVIGIVAMLIWDKGADMPRPRQ